MDEVYAEGPQRWSLFLWVMQRISGVFLIVLLFLHVVWLHYVDPDSVLTVAGVQVRLQSLLFGVTDTSLLGLAVFHGMNGMRGVLYDYIGSPLRRRAVSALLILAGTVLFAYGLYAFLPFVLGID